MIVLIPKIENPQKVTQLCPISLCNVVFKLVTKTIIARLKSILLGVVAPTQSSFVLERSITDNVIIVLEILHTMRTRARKKGIMAVKIDLEKAYDRV